MIDTKNITGNHMLCRDIADSALIADTVTLRNFIYIGEDAIVGANTKIANFCELNSGVVLGERCNLQTHVVLSRGTKVGNDCFFAGGVLVADIKYPGTGKLQIGKPTIIGNNVVIGMGALVIGGIKIGDDAVIGMGAVLTSDVPPGEVWAGNPAKPIYMDDVYAYGGSRKMTRQDYEIRKQAWIKKSSR